MSDTLHMNVFAGRDGMKNFLNPAHHLPTPLVELDDRLNRFTKDKIRIFVKLAYLSPLLTDKWPMAFNMLYEAYLRGGLEGVEEIIENSSGGSAFAMKIVAYVVFGIEKFRAYVPPTMAPAKLEGLRLIGVRYKFSGSSDLSGPEEAHLEGSKPGCFNPGQYHNPDNWKTYVKWLGPQIWHQTGGMITDYYAAGGTCGHVIGPDKYFQGQGANVRVRMVVPKEDQTPGARPLVRIDADVEFDVEKYKKDCIQISSKDAYRKSLKLVRHGILTGPSGGLVLEGIEEDLENTRSEWDQRRNTDGEIVIVFPCVDTFLNYPEKYSTHLDDIDFL